MFCIEIAYIHICVLKFGVDLSGCWFREAVGLRGCRFREAVCLERLLV